MLEDIEYLCYDGNHSKDYNLYYTAEWYYPLPAASDADNSLFPIIADASI